MQNLKKRSAICLEVIPSCLPFSPPDVVGSSSSRVPTEGMLLVSLTRYLDVLPAHLLRLLVGGSGTGRVKTVYKTQDDRSRKGSRKGQAEDEQKSRKDRNAEEVESIVGLDQKQAEAPQTGRRADRNARKKPNPDDFGAGLCVMLID